MKKFFLTMVCVLISGLLMSQDIHFSQFNSAPLNINPALTGLFNGNIRIVANHRNQWSAVTIPYVTFSASFDLNFRTHKKKDIMGVGLLVNTDKAGDTDFGTFQIAPSLSYTLPLSQIKKMFLTYGMQLGLTQIGFNSQKSTYDSQYNGISYDSSLPSGELFTASKVFYWDAAAGVNFNTEFRKDVNFNIGAALHHFNKPNVSFTSSDVTLSQRITLHSSMEFRYKSNCNLLPGIILLKQFRYTEITAGTNMKFFLEGSNAFYLGGWTRLKDRDAFILSTRLDQNNWSAGLSYDINISKLSEASHYRGAYEVSLMYIFRKDKSRILKNLPCPTFL
jgi:type IX secretion system PorP/SprF family membrane protein